MFSLFSKFLKHKSNKYVCKLCRDISRFVFTWDKKKCGPKILSMIMIEPFTFELWLWCSFIHLKCHFSTQTILRQIKNTQNVNNKSDLFFCNQQQQERNSKKETWSSDVVLTCFLWINSKCLLFPLLIKNINVLIWKVISLIIIACIRLGDKDEIQAFVLIPKRDIYWFMVHCSFNWQ